MKRYLLILVLSAFCVPAFASVTSEQVTSPEYLINAGWSELTAEEVAIEKNRKAGKPAEPLYQNSKFNNKFVNIFRNMYGYLDPSIDTEERIHHDIHPSPSWKDY